MVVYADYAYADAREWAIAYSVLRLGCSDLSIILSWTSIILLVAH